MVFPNLTNARRAVERLMVDTGQISRETEGDEILNEQTGEVSEPAPVVVYEGKCKVRAGGQGPRDEGGRSLSVEVYACAIPIGSPEIRPGDWFEIMSSARDFMLVGKKLRITEVEAGTMAVQRRFTAEAVVPQVSQARP